MQKKVTFLVALLAMVLVSSVPVLAQQVAGEEPPPEYGVIPEDPNRRAFDCAFLSGDPAAICLADENGFFTTASGVRFPVGATYEENRAAFIQYGGTVPGSYIGPPAS